MDLSEQILRQDAGGIYARMDFTSRENYRAAVSELAKASQRAEHEIASAAVDLARDAHAQRSLSGRARERRAHVGYYLVDKGRAELERAIGYKASVASRMRQFLLKFPDYFLPGSDRSARDRIRWRELFRAFPGRSFRDFSSLRFF